MMKITCYVNGKASIHLKSHQTNDSVDKRLRDEVLDIMNFLCFGWLISFIYSVECFDPDFKFAKLIFYKILSNLKIITILIDFQLIKT
jgi:hypothetical protein